MRGMYAIIALSCLCREESLKGHRVAPVPPTPSHPCMILRVNPLSPLQLFGWA